jgi:VanZ family protein
MKQLIIFIKPFCKYLLVIWVLTILSISSVPNLPSPKIETGGLKIRLDYIFHFFEYGILAFLTFLTFTKEGFNIGISKYLILTASLILFAVADEFHQKLIPGRSFNVKDILSNLSGIVAAVIFCYFMFRKMAKGLDL